MKVIVDAFNFLKIFFLGIVKLFCRASRTKKEAEKAQQLAKTKQLRKAVKMAEEILSWWSLYPPFSERLIRWLTVDDILYRLRSQVKSWQYKISKADKLAVQARNLEVSDNGNPFDIKTLSKALNLYQQCNRLICDDNLTNAAEKCNKKIELRKRFKSIFKQGQEEAKQGFFKQALSTLLKAKKLFSTEALEEAIATCKVRCQEEEKYETVLNQAYYCATEGRFQEAVALIKPILVQFSRSDGQELLAKLERLVKGKERFRAGLLAEKAGDFNVATTKYQEAYRILPELTESRIRLGILAVKNNNSTKALSYLEGISGEQAAYIRGFVYAKQGNWQQADREWKSVFHTEVKTQRQVLKTLVQRDRLLTIKKIEELVEGEHLEQAKSASLKFMEKFGSEPLVQGNLDGHIQLRLEATVWESQDWHTIAAAAEQNWLKRQDITSLHNWAVASYYQTQTDSTKLADLIIAWSTALANIHINPVLKDIPWLGSTPVDLREVSSNLTRLLEKSIDAVKDKNIEEYFRLRDRYRREVVALRLMGNSPSCGMRVVKEIFLTPGCYQRHRDYLPGISFPAQFWGALYTDWGLAVAACLEGDTARAIQIKPVNTPYSEAERFAFSLVSYHEGCYHIQNQNWREAITPLKQAKAEIKASSNWREEIDRLCGIQRQEIENFDEHLDFAQFWYELLGSQPARSYLAEYKAEQIREKFANEKISLSQALRELKKIKDIDERNPVVLELIKNVEIIQQIDEIFDLMKRHRFEEAIRRAKYSTHKEVKYRVAEFLIKILLKDVENRQMPPHEILQLGRWAKELCPYEPAFQEIYRSLELYY